MGSKTTLPLPSPTSTGTSTGKGREARRQAKRTLSFEHRGRLLCFLLFIPGFLVSLLLLLRANVSWLVIIGVLGSLLLLALVVMVTLVERIVRPLQTLANVVASLREGDYSFRAHGCRKDDALDEVAQEVNLLADMLQGNRLGELDATALLRNVMQSMDTPVLAFDLANNLRLINPAAERLLGIARERALGRNADDFHLENLLAQPDQGILDQGILAFGGERHADRWMVRKSSFRQRGIPHTLLILSDVSAPLREQEREAWQRLIRVLGHEINNSLTPIKSIAASLRSSAQSEERAASPDLERGLEIIESRAESLQRFIQAYRQLAQLPPPVLRPVSLRPLLERVAAVETRVCVQLEAGPDVFLELDADQVEQMMINLIRNAAEASLARASELGASRGLPKMQPEVRVSWQADRGFVEILVTDNGTGVVNPANLFVPFYTTKAGGTGIGLTLARQICEAHGGSIHLSNRADGPGCRAHVQLRQSSSGGTAAKRFG